MQKKSRLTLLLSKNYGLQIVRPAIWRDFSSHRCFASPCFSDKSPEGRKKNIYPF
jgi:hypothetical protein